jgi:hypothetical protein
MLLQEPLSLSLDTFFHTWLVYEENKDGIRLG